MSRVLAGLIVLAGAVTSAIIILTAPAPAPRPTHTLESLFQDDNHLVYASTPTVTRTLDTLQALGVQRIRVSVLWRAIAPDPSAATPPRRFDPSDPADYPPSNWLPYDRVVELAGSRGIGVDFNVGAPGPRWAMAAGAPSARLATHWYPSAAGFGRFVTALGRRYGGAFRDSHGAILPRVGFWSIWNEPNQPGWLAPQWRRVARRSVMTSPVLYRAYVRSAYAALTATAHGPARDTILIGELAPEGTESPRHTPQEPMPPMPFLRALYCVDPGYRPLSGAAARSLGCPSQPGRFRSDNPGLFDVTGFAHHPYSLFLGPNVGLSDPNFVPLANLGRLERALDVIFAAYGVARRPPLYLTEYGYATNPPNPYSGISLARQAEYLDQSEYLAWRDPRVRALSQFLLYDSPPDSRYARGSPRYWSTFQTGLLFTDGRPKPSLAGYRLPIVVPDPVLRTGPLFVWGRVRPAKASGARVAVQWRARAARPRTVAELTSRGASAIVTGEVSLPGPGEVRLMWRGYASRWVAIGP